MIYIDQNTTNITIPCNTSKVSVEYTLVLKHRMSGTEYEYTVTDLMISKLYYYFEQSFQDLLVGEYDLKLLSNDKKVASGLLQYETINTAPTSQKKYYQRERTIKIYQR